MRSGWRLRRRHLAAEFGRELVDHRTYVLASDGDLMEGISQEAIALAGHLRAQQVDCAVRRQRHFNRRTVWLANSVDQVKRFEAAGWAAVGLTATIPKRSRPRSHARSNPTVQSLIACRTTIGFGAPTKAGTEKSHGSPLGTDEIAGDAQRPELVACAVRDPSRNAKRMACGRPALAPVTSRLGQTRGYARG